VFCDWHLELAKPVLQGGAADPVVKAETQATIAYVLDMIYATLHPFMPFLTEELWAITGQVGPGRAGPLALGPWPAQGFEVDEAVEGEIGWVVDLIAEVRSVRSEMGVPPSTQTPLILVSPSERASRSARDWSESIGRLARIASIETADAAPAGALLLVVRGETVALPLVGVVDLGAEKARLDREIAKEKLEIAKVEAKLGNDDFVARAPEEIIAEHQDRLETFQARLVKLTGARERLERV
jgi:valyl-tRNA synthetase